MYFFYVFFCNYLFICEKPIIKIMQIIYKNLFWVNLVKEIVWQSGRSRNMSLKINKIKQKKHFSGFDQTFL